MSKFKDSFSIELYSITSFHMKNWGTVLFKMTYFKSEAWIENSLIHTVFPRYLIFKLQQELNISDFYLSWKIVVLGKSVFLNRKKLFKDELVNYFCGMVDRRKAISLISSRNHCQRSSPSRISDMPRTGFEPAQNLSLGLVGWSCAVVITTTPRRLLNISLLVFMQKQYPENFAFLILKILELFARKFENFLKSRLIF